MQIPVFGESQVMQPGNPVPIGEADDPMSKALDSLGTAMLSLGNEMSKQEKAKRDKQNQYNVQTAIEIYESDMRTYNEQTLWGDPESRKDMTGLVARQKSIDQGANLRKIMVENSSFNPEQIAMFDAGARKVQNQLDPQLMVKASIETEKDYKAAVDTNIFAMAAQVAAQPGLFEDRMAQVDIDVANDPNARNKALEIRERKQKLVMSVYNKVRFMNDFKGAKGFLEKNAGLFDPKEVSKELDALQSDQTSYVNRQNTEEIQRDRNYEKQNKALQSTKAVILLEEYEASAGVGPFATEKVKQKILMEALMGQAGNGQGISMETYNTITSKPPGAQQAVDTSNTGKLLARAYTSGNFTRAMKENEQMYFAGKISEKTFRVNVTEIGKQQMYQKNRATDKTWDISKMAFNETMAYMRSIGKDPNSLDTVQTKKMHQIIFEVLNDAQTQIKNGNTYNVKGAISNIAEKYGAEFSPAAPNTPNGVQRGTGTIQELEGAKMKKIRQLKNGTDLTPSQKSSILNDIELIRTQIKLKQNDNVKRGNDATGSGSPGTRSSDAVRRTAN